MSKDVPKSVQPPVPAAAVITLSSKTLDVVQKERSKRRRKEQDEPERKKREPERKRRDAEQREKFAFRTAIRQRGGVSSGSSGRSSGRRVGHTYRPWTALLSMCGNWSGWERIVIGVLSLCWAASCLVDAVPALVAGDRQAHTDIVLNDDGKYRLASYAHRFIALTMSGQEAFQHDTIRHRHADVRNAAIVARIIGFVLVGRAVMFGRRSLATFGMLLLTIASVATSLAIYIDIPLYVNASFVLLFAASKVVQITVLVSLCESVTFAARTGAVVVMLTLEFVVKESCELVIFFWPHRYSWIFDYSTFFIFMPITAVALWFYQESLIFYLTTGADMLDLSAILARMRRWAGAQAAQLPLARRVRDDHMNLQNDIANPNRLFYSLFAARRFNYQMIMFAGVLLVLHLDQERPPVIEVELRMHYWQARALVHIGTLIAAIAAGLLLKFLSRRNALTVVMITMAISRLALALIRSIAQTPVPADHEFPAGSGHLRCVDGVEQWQWAQTRDSVRPAFYAVWLATDWARRASHFLILLRVVEATPAVIRPFMLCYTLVPSYIAAVAVNAILMAADENVRSVPVGTLIQGLLTLAAAILQRWLLDAPGDEDLAPEDYRATSLKPGDLQRTDMATTSHTHPDGDGRGGRSKQKMERGNSF